jgi:AraC family transcriptional regulator, transcriptional activator FtrA
MSTILRSAVYVAAFTLPPLAIGTVRGKAYLSRYGEGLTIAAPLAPASLPAPPAHDPSKPTVAVLLGADVTEITDALGPYEIFSRAGRYNVYMVAPERRPSLLTGGLRILPHLSLAQLDDRLGGRPAAVVVVPNIPNIKRAENRPLLGWIRRQAAAGALMHSWCAGAYALAESGILDGRRVTTHWGDIDALERAYPKVTWVRGVRWVEDEGLVASAGINSGIDASLRVLVRRDGDSVARRVAAELRYPNYRYVVDPTADQFEIRPADAVLLVNAAFRTGRKQIGVALYDGVGELAISNVYDAQAASAVADIHAVAATPGVVTTLFGATLLPSLAGTRDDGAIRRLDRLVVTGEDGAPPNVTTSLSRLAPELSVVSLDTDANRYPLESVLEDLARNADVPSARFAEKRLEYRSRSVTLRGSVLPWRALWLPFGIGAVGVLFTWLTIRQRGRARSAFVAAALLFAAPSSGRAQSVQVGPTSTRIRIDVHTGERTLLRRPKTQALSGTLVATRGDTLLLAVQPGADPVRVPRSSIHDLYVSRGTPNRLESAVRRATMPTLVSAAATALSLSVRQRAGDPSPARGALSAAASAAVLSGALGLISPKERWQRVRWGRLSVPATVP